MSKEANKFDLVWHLDLAMLPHELRGIVKLPADPPNIHTANVLPAA